MSAMPPLLPVEATVPLCSLRTPPLKRVVCVLQFQPILIVSDPSGLQIAPFQNLVRADYPDFRQDTMHEVHIHGNPSGQITDTPSLVSFPVWSFLDATGVWKISLTRASLSVEATGVAYAGRDSLIDRFAFAMNALHSTFESIVCTRLGFRYLNLFEDEKLVDVRKYIRPEILGYGPPVEGDGVRSSFGQVEFERAGDTFLLKYGFVGAGFVNEMTPAPLEQPAWLLDIDGFRTPEPTGGESSLRVDAVRLTSEICELFRQSVTSDFIEEYRDDA